ncbi:hypothetical protein BaRGS_00022615 [Batillaria attramentaria]|uniref:Asteroid domain-containing protein n=1 Tax=Batillaria attramentaria TaxID=370345 RepID=A0ABD0KGG5_9CAEN
MNEVKRKQEILQVCAGQAQMADLEEDAIIRGVLLEIQVVRTLRDSGCEVIQMPVGEADLLIAKHMAEREKAYAVLSNDSDFCVFKNCCFIPHALFDIGGDLGLTQPLVLPKKPQRLMCGVVSSQGVQQMLQFSDADMIVELGIIAGNDFTSHCLRGLAGRAGVRNTRSLMSSAEWIRQYKRVDNCDVVRQEMARNRTLASAVEYSRTFYAAIQPGEGERDKSAYIYTLISDRIRTGEYPATFLPMYRCFYWQRSLLDDTQLCPPTEEMLAPLRAYLYGIILPRHKSGVTEWGQTHHQDLTQKTNNAVDDRNLPAINHIRDNQIFKNLKTFHYIMTHLEYGPVPEKTWFDKYGRKTGFICYVLRYFLLLNWGQCLDVTEPEFVALAAVALGASKESAWQEMPVCPDPRCVSIAAVFQDIYRHAFSFLGTVLHLTHEFPLPREIFSGSMWTILYALSGSVGSAARMFPLSSYDQLAYIPGERLHWAEIERDAILHDKRHVIRTLVDGVFYFDDRRY